MKPQSNISFKVGMAPVKESMSISVNGETVTVSEGFMFNVKLLEDGNFRFQTSFHVTKEDAVHPEFKKNIKKTLDEHRQFLEKHFENTWVRNASKIINIGR